MDIFPVANRVEKLDTTGVRALENRVLKLPDSTILVRLQIRNAGEVVDVNGANQPATTTETSKVGRRLQQSTQLTRGSRVVRPAIKRLDSTGTVQHSTVTTTRHRNTDVGHIGRVALDPVNVPGSVKVVDRNVTEEIPQGGGGLVTARI